MLVCYSEMMYCGPKRRLKSDWAVSDMVMGEQKREENMIGSNIFFSTLLSLAQVAQLPDTIHLSNNHSCHSRCQQLAAGLRSFAVNRLALSVATGGGIFIII